MQRLSTVFLGLVVLTVCGLCARTAAYDAKLTDVIRMPMGSDFSNIFGTAAQSPTSNDMFLGTNGGLVYKCARNSSGLYSTPLCAPALDIRDRVMPTDLSFAQFGLLGMAFEDGNDARVYVGYTTPCTATSGIDCTYYRGLTRVSHFAKLNASHYDPSSEFILFEAPTGANSSDRHVGGGMLVTKHKGQDVVLFGMGDGSPGARIVGGTVYDECRLPFSNHRADNARHYTLCGACPGNCTNPVQDNYYGAIIGLRADCTVQKACKTVLSTIALNDDGSEPSVALAKGFRMPYSIEPSSNGLIIADVGENAIESIYVIKKDDLLNGVAGRPVFGGWNIREGPIPLYYLYTPAATSSERVPRPDLLMGASPTYTTLPYAYYEHTDRPGGIGNSIIGAFYHAGDRLDYAGIVSADYSPIVAQGIAQKYYYVDDGEADPQDRVKQFNVINAAAFEDRFLTRIVGLGHKNANKRDVYVLTIDVATMHATVTILTNP